MRNERKTCTPYAPLFHINNGFFIESSTLFALFLSFSLPFFQRFAFISLKSGKIMCAFSHNFPWDVNTRTFFLLLLLPSGNRFKCIIQLSNGYRIKKVCNKAKRRMNETKQKISTNDKIMDLINLKLIRCEQCKAHVSMSRNTAYSLLNKN